MTVLAVDFSKQIQKAEEAVRRRNYDFAIQVYQQLLEIDPDQGEARSALRHALKKRHESKKGGLSVFRSITGVAPLAVAKTLRKAGRHAACVKTLEAYLSLNPLDAEANLLLGLALEDAQHFQSARAVYDFLAEIAPKDPVGLKRAGSMTYRLGDHAKALEYYERALEVDPRDQEALKARKDLSAERALSGALPAQGHSRDQIKDKEEALALERSRRIHQTDDDLRTELGKLETEHAEAPNPDRMARMAEIHEKLKDSETALEWIERALSYRKDSYDFVCRRGDLKAKVLRKAVSNASKDGNDQLANELERELWDFEVEDYRLRLGLHPADPNLKLQLGRRLMRVGDHAAAMGELQKAINDPRTKRDAQFLLAQCFQAKGYLDLARREYHRALELASAVDDRTKEILYNLGSIAESAGDQTEARGFYARIYEVDIGYRDVAEKMERFN